MKYRKKPVVIDAVQWNGKNLFEIVTFLEGKEPNLKGDINKFKWEEYENIVKINGVTICTLEGDMKASISDYIIKGVAGEFYPCKEDRFLKTYELAE